MAPISPGKPGGVLRKAKRKSAPTPTRNLHRYETFTKRISRLKIDPVHAVDKRNDNSVDTDLSHSFFRASLDEWSELNLSQTFTDFLGKVNPLSENLPQLLHHAETIFQLLIQSIEKQDALALEPLLGLVAHFAHDLGHRFERFFSRAVEVVAKVAAAHDKADVVEWCFTCLAWMFKYLSRLLVQDIRPLLAIMMPYLSHKKDYIVRFSAESLAFLLRKAALLYSKKKTPLQLAVQHLFEQLIGDDPEQSQASLQIGVMSLCIESSSGVEGQFHSSTPSLITCLLDSAESFLGHEVIQLTIRGILVALIHEGSQSEFQPILEIVLQACQKLVAAHEATQIMWALNLLHVVIGTRKGARILNWKETIDTFSTVSEVAIPDDQDLIKARRLVIIVLAELFQYTPMDQLLPRSGSLLGWAVTKLSSKDYFSMCTICARLGKQRFVDLLLPGLQQYIVDRWSEDQTALFFMLETLREEELITNRPGSSDCMFCPPPLEAFILEQLTKLTPGSTSWKVENVAGQLRLAKNMAFAQNSENTIRVTGAMRKVVSAALSEQKNDPDLPTRMLLGWGLDSYLEIVDETEAENEDLLSLALKSAPINFRLPTFISSILGLLQARPTPTEAFDEDHLTRVQQCLVQNLLSTSIELKTGSLKLLSKLVSGLIRPSVAEVISIMLEILETAYTPTEVRKITMMLRRLPQRQGDLASHRALRDSIPYFCLGILSHYHDATRKEVCNILAQLSQDTAAEESLLNVVIQWLQVPVLGGRKEKSGSSTGHVSPSSFNCTSLCHDEEVSTQVMNDYVDPLSSFRTLIENAHKLEMESTPDNNRALALQVLSAIPASAERRSRLLVPIFLGASMNRARMQANANSESSKSSFTMGHEVDDHEWSLSDRKAFLLLLSQFNNPRVLYKSTEVYEKVLELLCNGNIEIRKLALQAIVKWKDPTVKAYEDVLLQVVDEKTNITNLAELLSSDEADERIRKSDRHAILPILLRLVFGLIIGRSGTTGQQEARRKAILRNLFRMREGEAVMFIDIALGRLREVRGAAVQTQIELSKQPKIPEDQQYGFLRLLLSMMETLEVKFAPYGPQVVDAVVFCITHSSPQPAMAGQTVASIPALTRHIRRVGLQCLLLLFEYCPEIEWGPYTPTLFQHLISPRLDNFASETSQGISGLLRLFATWARSQKLCFLLRDEDPRIPSALWECLVTKSAQVDVKVFILEEIVLPWLSSAEDYDKAPNVAKTHINMESDGLLKSLTEVLDQTPPRAILSTVTSILPRLAKFASSSTSKRNLIQLLNTLVRGPEFKLSPDIKSRLLVSIQSFLEADDTGVDDSLRLAIWDSVSSLFNFFKDQPNRLVLCKILDQLSRDNQDASQTAQLCFDLNATSTQRLEEFDYETRLEAFHAISSIPATSNTARAWSPIVFNLLFFVRTLEDFAIRSNALAALKQFVIRATGANNDELKDLVREVVLPGTIKGSRHESELIRADFVSLYGLLIQHFSDNEELSDKVTLLVDNDEEASFFTNILHIQQHRRLRAIRRLLSEVEKGTIKSKSVAEFFIPLLEMFVYDSSGDESAQGTKGQSIAAMGVLLQWIDWKHFKVLFRKYKNDLSLNHSQRDTVKLLGHAADALLATRHLPKDMESLQPRRTHLQNSIRDATVLENEIRARFIPRLAELVHYKDEAEMSFRIPVAVTSIKLVKVLPAEEVASTAAPILLDIAHILKSRTQESRDTARNALAQIVVLLGPSSLQFVIKEMRTALIRGYQLHVLSYTVHTILLALVPTTKAGELDYCIEDVVGVAIDDIFGAVGQEKDNQDYISSMKEVKSSKSFDTIELVAQTTAVTALTKLVTPVQTILSGTLSTKQARQVDEWLRRIGAGIARNPGASRQDILVFSYQLIEAFYKQKRDVQRREPTLNEQNRQRYLVQLSSAHKTTSGMTSPLLYKLARFAIDLVRSILQKHGELLTAENVHGFLPVIGDVLIEGQEDVKISALRLLSSIVKLQMPELEQNAPVYVLEAVKIVKNSTNTNEEAAQAALKLVAGVLRERKNVKVRDLDVAELLHRITPDIEEPDRQGVTFNFIRAVMSRQIQIPEIYELVDKVGIMMVTNQARGARDIARGVYVHFLLEYPQSRSRWAKQQKFLLKNLEYEYPEGRQSVMEAINTLVQKLRGDVAGELLSSLFIPVLLRVANDENKTCRELAGLLLGQLFSSADSDRLKEFLEPMQSWLKQKDNTELQKIGLQAYSVLLSTESSFAEPDVALLRDDLSKTLLALAKSDDGHWEAPFQALVVLSKLVEKHPATILIQGQGKLWSTVWRLLDHPNPWIQSTVASLVHAFFRDCSPDGLSKVPLICSHGLTLSSQEILAIIKSSVRKLKRTDGNEDLSGQMVQNLLFLAQCLDTNGITMDVSIRQKTELEDDASVELDTDDGEASGPEEVRKISAIQYILDQMAAVLRLEIGALKTASLIPKLSAVELLAAMIPAISLEHLSKESVEGILLPLQHLTDTNTIAPRSADPTFAAAYQRLVEQAHEVMESVQRRIGDSEYVKALTEVSKVVRQRREERRTKRRIDRVADPERAAKEKKRKADRKKERKREIGRSHQRRRMEGGM